MLYSIRVSRRLMLTAAALVIPLCVSVAIIVRQNQANIDFAQSERVGIEYQQPLMGVLHQLGEVQDALARRLPTDDARKKVEAAFAELEKVHAHAGLDLQFTEPGLAARKRDGLLPDRLAKRFTAADGATVAGVSQLRTDVRTMIAHAGDTSNLILDPDLDTYYLMDVMLCAVPQTLDRLQQIRQFITDAAADGKLDDQEHIAAVVMAAKLEEMDADRIKGSGTTALAEDANFYGKSDAFQTALPPALANYDTAARAVAEKLRTWKTSASTSASTSAETDDVRTSVNHAITATNDLFAQSATQLDSLLRLRVAAYAQMGRVYVGSAIGAGLLAGLVLWLVSRSIVRQLGEASTRLTAIGRQLAVAAQQVAASGHGLATETSRQVTALQQTTASLEQLAAKTTDNNSAAREASAVSANGSKTTREGADAMRQFGATMAEIQDASRQAGKVIRVINEIAFQTNMLALNAAVEAARAGTAGAGFAVVADEVRNLAIRSSTAAQDTQRTIDRAIEAGRLGAELSGRVSALFHSINSGTQQFDAIVEKIAGATEEQTQGLTQINKAVAELDQATHRNASVAEESAHASQQMQSETEQLRLAANELALMIGQPPQPLTSPPLAA